jgi:hypothetical protein
MALAFTSVSSWKARPVSRFLTAANAQRPRNLSPYRAVEPWLLLLLLLLLLGVNCSCLQILLYHTAALVLCNLTLRFLYWWIYFACLALINFMLFIPCIFSLSYISLTNQCTNNVHWLLKEMYDRLKMHCMNNIKLDTSLAASFYTGLKWRCIQVFWHMTSCRLENMAVRWLRDLPMRIIGSYSRPTRVEFVVEKWHWYKFFSECFAFPLSVSFSQCSILIN